MIFPTKKENSPYQVIGYFGHISNKINKIPKNLNIKTAFKTNNRTGK